VSGVRDEHIGIATAGSASTDNPRNPAYNLIGDLGRICAFEPQFMKVGILTAALQELTPRSSRPRCRS
jgi:hypothetical protein